VALDKAAIQAELARLRAVDKEREKKHNQKFKGMSYLGSLCRIYLDVL
jgi:hypothetical protein